MSIADAPREEKIDWLFRPIEWAGYLCGIGGGIALLMLLNGDVGAEVVAYLAVGALITAAGIQIWGLRRVRLVANGFSPYKSRRGGRPHPRRSAH